MMQLCNNQNRIIQRAYENSKSFNQRRLKKRLRQLHQTYAVAVTDSQTVTIPAKTEKIVPYEQDQVTDKSKDNNDNIWALFALSVCYLHYSVTGFVLPAILPYVSRDLQLNDVQGGALTLGYTLLYALALTPAGLLVDKLPRPQLLAVGSASWSILTQFAAKAHSFQELLFCRVGFACAQAVQNPICFTLIPELFPKNRATAMALYNSAIYLGRSLSFTVALLCSQIGIQNPFQVQMVPMDSLDVSTMSILYTTGDMVAVVPLYNYDFQIIYDIVEKQPQAWRSLLDWMGLPGLVVAALILVLVKERPDHNSADIMKLVKSTLSSIGWRRLFKQKLYSTPSLEEVPNTQRQQFSRQSVRPIIRYSSTTRKYPLYRKKAQLRRFPRQQAVVGRMQYYRNSPLHNQVIQQDKQNKNIFQRILSKLSTKQQSIDINKIDQLISKQEFSIFGSTSFLALTLAAGLNDVGSWAMIAWHATFYERAFDLSPDVYAPLLAFVIPLGGIAGGVGGGLIADKLSIYGKRSYLTVGAMLLAVPLITMSFLTDSYQLSFLYLLIGFALSEAWRAPAAIMVRSTVPAEKVGYASAVHLSLRNLVGCLGPLGVALLISRIGVQQAMTLVPSCYFLSAMRFWWVESIIED